MVIFVLQVFPDFQVCNTYWPITFHRFLIEEFVVPLMGYLDQRFPHAIDYELLYVRIALLLSLGKLGDDLSTSNQRLVRR